MDPEASKRVAVMLWAGSSVSRGHTKGEISKIHALLVSGRYKDLVSAEG